ncbi:putative toxin-antitoxin system toxin component, PIN family [Algoriphagus boritolerans DSM 17298 = JCM 18970]|uniref:Putative toxin-antitoxin system toxin component, PIN family n=1 Tax=Algoriphagus boritolerans DSM 17298 = JCM 18970 TaxID=1120964 RepID=A0A1H5UV97_9BACT|nr:putative toxin-antitoxin system toxin component, PIN family [Algoriphagus boritolerans DSM 17298 = JCM 18970]
MLVSAHLLEDSVSKRVVDLAFLSFLVLYSDETLQEFESVLLRSKFDRYSPIDKRKDAISYFSKIAIPTKVRSSFQICRDSKDDKYLQLAFDGYADFLITGDQDLLVLNPFHGIRILSPAEFLFILEN